MGYMFTFPTVGSGWVICLHFQEQAVDGLYVYISNSSQSMGYMFMIVKQLSYLSKRVNINDPLNCRPSQACRTVLLSAYCYSFHAGPHSYTMHVLIRTQCRSSFVHHPGPHSYTMHVLIRTQCRSSFVHHPGPHSYTMQVFIRTSCRSSLIHTQCRLSFSIAVLNG